jgi:hypothetical protein
MFHMTRTEAESEAKRICEIENKPVRIMKMIAIVKPVERFSFEYFN